MSSTGRGPRLGGAEDFYVTPAWCVDRLLEVWHPTERGTWLEPAAGNGAIIRAANARRPGLSWCAVEVRAEEREVLTVTGTAVHVGDFLSDEVAVVNDVSVVIGNPPFSLAMEFVQRALDCYPNARVAFLLRLNFAGSEERGIFMRRCPPSVYVLPNRPAFANGKTDSCEYAWFVWPRGDLRERDAGHFRVLGSTPAAERRKKVPDLGTTAQGVSSYPNARGVDGAAAIPRSENDATETRTETGAVPPGSTCEVVTRPGEQRPLFGGGG